MRGWLLPARRRAWTPRVRIPVVQAEGLGPAEVGSGMSLKARVEGLVPSAVVCRGGALDWIPRL